MKGPLVLHHLMLRIEGFIINVPQIVVHWLILSMVSKSSEWSSPDSPEDYKDPHPVAQLQAIRIFHAWFASRDPKAKRQIRMQVLPAAFERP